MAYEARRHPETNGLFAIYNTELGLWLTEPAECPAYFGERIIMPFESMTEASEIAGRWNALDELTAYSQELGFYD